MISSQEHDQLLNIINQILVSPYMNYMIFGHVLLDSKNNKIINLATMYGDNQQIFKFKKLQTRTTELIRFGSAVIRRFDPATGKIFRIQTISVTLNDCAHHRYLLSTYDNQVCIVKLEGRSNARIIPLTQDLINDINNIKYFSVSKFIASLRHIWINSIYSLWVIERNRGILY